MKRTFLMGSPSLPVVRVWTLCTIPTSRRDHYFSLGCTFLLMQAKQETPKGRSAFHCLACGFTEPALKGIREPKTKKLIDSLHYAPDHYERCALIHRAWGDETENQSMIRWVEVNNVFTRIY